MNPSSGNTQKKLRPDALWMPDAQGTNYLDLALSPWSFSLPVAVLVLADINVANIATTSGFWCQACDTEAQRIHLLEYVCSPHACHYDGCDRRPFMVLRGITEIPLVQ